MTMPADLLLADPAGEPPPVPHLSIVPTRGWAALNFREAWQFRDLLFSLAGRDLKLRYKQTVLGVSWVVLQPLMAAGIFTVVFGKIANLPSHGVPKFLFSYAGMLGWSLFANTLTKTSACLVGNAQLISKIYFPRLVLPMSVLPSVAVDFGVGLTMLAVLMAAFGVAPGWSLLLLPVWVAVLVLLAMGIGLCAAALAVSYRDVQYILPVAVNAALFASPVGYALSDAMTKLSAHRWWQMAYLANPLAAPLEAFRWSALGAAELAPPAWPLAYAAAAAVLAFVAGAFSFKRMERRFADVI